VPAPPTATGVSSITDIPSMRPLGLALAALLPAAAIAHATRVDGTATPAVQPGQASPRDTARGTVGGTSVMVDYGRPSKRGRTIFAANGLVPYGKVWRTGANSATTLVTSKDLMIGTTRVPAGTYTLYTVPTADAWQLVVNKQTGQWGTEYDQAQDLARIPMTVTKLSAPIEQFTIAVEPAALVMKWDTVQASVPLKASTK
jgi:hypothetical protein